MDTLSSAALNAVIVFSLVGIVGGFALAWAAMKFKVEVDPRVAAARGALPGANCGACGFAGCESYAEAVITDSAVAPNKCSPGGAAVAAKIASIAGKAAAEICACYAVLKCARPGWGEAAKFEYLGMPSCAAAVTAFGGPNACAYGCMGLGDCAKACPFHAIQMAEGGKPVIDYDKCTGCGVCVHTCPKMVLELVPQTASAVILCSNPEKGGAVRTVCDKGCITCLLCVKNGPEGVFVQRPDDMIVTDYDKSSGIALEQIEEVRTKCRPKVLHAYSEVLETNRALIKQMDNSQAA